jgi:hypothetical protein
MQRFFHFASSHSLVFIYVDIWQIVYAGLLPAYLELDKFAKGGFDFQQSNEIATALRRESLCQNRDFP